MNIEPVRNVIEEYGGRIVDEETYNEGEVTDIYVKFPEHNGDIPYIGEIDACQRLSVDRNGSTEYDGIITHKPLW